MRDAPEPSLQIESAAGSRHTVRHHRMAASMPGMWRRTTPVILECLFSHKRDVADRLSRHALDCEPSHPVRGLRKDCDELSAVPPGISVVLCACGVGANDRPVSAGQEVITSGPLLRSETRPWRMHMRKKQILKWRHFRIRMELTGGFPACVTRLNDDSLPPR